MKTYNPKRYSLDKKCLDCKTKISNFADRCKSCSNRKKQKEYKWSSEHKKNYIKSMEARRLSGEGSLSLNAVHLWMKRCFGKAKRCEVCNIKNYRYEWSKKHGHEYIKDRNSFWELCVKCHRKYDNNNPINRYTKINLAKKLATDNNNEMKATIK